MAKGKSREWWRAQIAALESSGQSQRTFAESNGIPLTSLQKWLYVERKARQQAGLPAMVQVQWRPQPEVVARVGGVEFRIAGGTDAAWLADVLGRLGRAAVSC